MLSKYMLNEGIKWMNAFWIQLGNLRENSCFVPVYKMKWLYYHFFWELQRMFLETPYCPLRILIRWNKLRVRTTYLSSLFVHEVAVLFWKPQETCFSTALSLKLVFLRCKMNSQKTTKVFGYCYVDKVGSKAIYNY